MKIVSIHANECKNIKCPERKVCYLCKRNITGGKITPSVYRSVLKELDDKTSHVHYATDVLNDEAKRLLEAGANITIPFNVLKANRQYLDLFKDHVQVSIYQLDEIFLNENDLLEYQKLFLIKDTETLNIANDIIETGSMAIGKIHFPIDQNWARNNIISCKDFLLKYYGNDLIDSDITIDNCAAHYLTNGKCGYISNYVDINFDGTYRKCPFEINGDHINNKTIDDMIATEYEPRCLWAFMFKRK